MIVVDCEQGSEEWQAIRQGIPTASQFSRIITATGKPSASATGYMHELLAEYLLDKPTESFSSGWMERGKEQEQEAADFYEFEHGVDTSKIGFCLRDDKRVGCSPDRLVGMDGLLEIKVPKAQTHVAYLLGSASKEYKVQIQGQLYIAEREWCDILSFNPNMPPAETRCERDEPFIKTMGGLIDEFLADLDKAKEQLEQKGIVPFDPFN